MSECCKHCGGDGWSDVGRRLKDEWDGQAPFDPVAYGAKPITVNSPGLVILAERNLKAAPAYYGVGPMALECEKRRLFSAWRWSWSHNLIQADVDALRAEGRLFGLGSLSVDEVNQWSMSSAGHDTINQHVCVKARAEREGLGPVECQHCSEGSEDEDDDGDDDGDKDSEDDDDKSDGLERRVQALEERCEALDRRHSSLSESMRSMMTALGFSERQIAELIGDP